MTVIDEYLDSLNQEERAILEHMYGVVREMVPGAAEELSYAMPAFTLSGRGVIAIIANKHFLSLYPFCAVERLGLDLSAFETTKGSIHFTIEQPISDSLLREVITARLALG